MPPDQATVPAKIMVIDDVPANVLFLQTVLQRSGYEVVGCTRSVEAIALYQESKPDLILLDLHMPEMDGYELLVAFRALVPDSTELPILVFTADVTPAACIRALDLGATDFLTKPGIVTEITLRVRNFLLAHRTHMQLQALNTELEEKVKARTLALWESQIEVLERLARVGERRDDQTGAHAKRVGEFSGLIATEMGLNRTETELIRLAAPLHDIGKVGIPDNILLKRGILTDSEVEVMRTHAKIGEEILSGGRTLLMVKAAIIAFSHHERWDGNGYPQRLAGESIPLAARIVALADAYDALSSERPYKRAFTHEESAGMIVADSGKHFDPKVVQAFLRVAPSFLSALPEAA